jgi:hypothetical protein
LTIDPTATLDLSGNNTRVLDGWTVNNAGTAVWSGGDFRTGNHAVFNNTGLFEIQSGQDLSFDYDYTLGDGSLATFNNSGTFVQTPGSGPGSFVSSFYSYFNNSGTVEVQTGVLGLRGGGTSSGSFDGWAGTTLSFLDSHQFTASSSIVGDNVNLFGNVFQSPITVGGTYLIAAALTEILRPEGQSYSQTVAFFSRAPRQYRIRPRRIDATVPTISSISKLNLFAESPGGTSDTKIPTSTTTNPKPPISHTPGMPPGTSTACSFAARSLRYANLITPANMYKNGMKYRMIAASIKI